MRAHILFGILRSLLLLAIFAALNESAFATVDGILTWQPVPGGIRYLIPKVRGVPPEQFTARYQETLKSSPSYATMEHTALLNLSTSPETFGTVPASTSEHPNVVAFLNRPAQMTELSCYTCQVVERFEREGLSLFSVPVGLGRVLSPKEMQQFRKLLNQFDGQLGIGGDDPHPLTYGKTSLEGTLGDLNLERDLELQEYFREYIRHGKGRVFYICSSYEHAAILDGHGFHPDISHLTAAPQFSANGVSVLEIEALPGSELAIAAGSTRFKTSNFHHAGVDADRPQDPAKPPRSQITAYNVEPDGSRGRVVKAIEFPGNIGFGTQFHPEFGNSPEEDRIIRYVATGWKMRGRPSPHAIAQCMLKVLKTGL